MNSRDGLAADSSSAINGQIQTLMAAAELTNNVINE